MLLENQFKFKLGVIKLKLKFSQYLLIFII